MCQICEVAAPEVGAGAAPRFAAASATSPALRRAAPINLEAAHSAAAAMLKGVGVQGRRTLIKGGTVLSANLRRTRESRKIRPGLPLHPYDGMSELGWKAAADAGAHMSIAAPIEMHMRHGTPPIQNVRDLGMSASLSSDVECTMTADMFTQMRSVLTLQRMLANELALQGKEYPKPSRSGTPSSLRRWAEQKASRSKARRVR